MSHIGLASANSDDFEELICDDCMKAHAFLWKYNKLAKDKEVDVKVDVTTVEDNSEPNPKRPRLEDGQGETANESNTSEVR